jgi:glycyl-tRNA synthetase
MDSDLSTRVDKSSAALGRRYARSDEVGVPFAVTVDFETLVDGSVTVRERDSTVQVRLHKEEVAPLVFAFVHKKMTWEQAMHKYPVVTVDDGDEKTSDAAASTSNGKATVVVNTGRARFSRPAAKIQ